MEAIVLTTGATGRFASLVTPELIQRGTRIRALVRNPQKAGSRTTAHISTKNTSAISAPDHIRLGGDGLFPGYVFPGTACQATIGVSLRDAACSHFANSL